MLNYNGEITLPCFTSFDSEKKSEYFIMPSDMTFCMLIHNNTIYICIISLFTQNNTCIAVLQW